MEEEEEEEEEGPCYQLLIKGEKESTLEYGKKVFESKEVEMQDWRI